MVTGLKVREETNVGKVLDSTPANPGWILTDGSAVQNMKANDAGYA